MTSVKASYGGRIAVSRKIPRVVIHDRRSQDEHDDPRVTPHVEGHSLPGGGGGGTVAADFSEADGTLRTRGHDENEIQYGSC